MPASDRKNASVLSKRLSRSEKVRLVPATHSSERERVRNWHILPPHDLTLHTNLQFALVSQRETLLVGGCAATVFADAVQPPFFMLSFCLLIDKSLLTSPLIYPTTISPLNHIKSFISSVFPNFHFKTTLNTDSVITGKAGNKRFLPERWAWMCIYATFGP